MKASVIASGVILGFILILAGAAIANYNVPEDINGQCVYIGTVYAGYGFLLIIIGILSIIIGLIVGLAVGNQKQTLMAPPPPLPPNRSFYRAKKAPEVACEFKRGCADYPQKCEMCENNRLRKVPEKFAIT
jgi:hypothetical protein